MSIRGIKVIFSGDPREREEGVIRKTGSRFSGTCASRYSGGMEREPQPPERDEAQDERERRTSNILLLVFFVAVVGAGIWLVNAMVDQRRLDDCLAQGRRNCAPIEAR